MPSLTSSQAVRRAPCRNGRVSSARNRHLLALLHRRPDHAKRGAIPCRRQRTGVAVREDIGRVWHQRGAVRAHRPAARDVLVVNPASIGDEALPDLAHRTTGLCGLRERPFHALDRPKQIHGSGPRRRQQVAGLLKLRGEPLRAGRSALQHAERDPHGGSHANGWRAANDHRPDRPGHFGRGSARDVDFRGRQLPLVDHHNMIALPLDRRQHERR